MAHKPIKMDKSWSLYSLFSMLLGKSCSIKNVDMGTHNRPRKKHTTLKTFLAFSGNKTNLILFRILYITLKFQDNLPVRWRLILRASLALRLC